MRQLSEQTASFIKALEYVLLAENELIKSLCENYGEEQGDKFFEDDFKQQIDNLKEAVKLWVGHSVEINVGYLNENIC